MFALAEQLRPWSMIEVFVFGVFVAYVKLGDVVQIGLETGIYALLALTFVIIWADARWTTKVWDRLDQQDAPTAPRRCAAPRSAGRGRLRNLRPGQRARPDDPRCPRCDAPCMRASPTACRGPGLW